LRHCIKYQLFTISLVILSLVGTLACTGKPKKSSIVGKVAPERHADFKAIKERGKLVVLAENSANSYFIYRGAKMGVEYEILKYFAKENGLELEVIVVKDLDEINQMLNDGVGDIIACNYTITKDRLKEIDFSIPIMRTAQVLIQRKPDDFRTRKKKDWMQDLVRDPEQLIGKKIHVWKNSSYYNRLKNLQEELGDTIYIQAIGGEVIPEELIRLVAEGFIDYTVTDQNVAWIHQRYYDNIDASLALSVNQRIAFGLRKTSPVLKEKLDNWLKDFMKTTTFSYIKHKYFKLSVYSSKVVDDYSSIRGGKISPYDDIMREVAHEYGWDWRFLAALIYQESKFKTEKVSFAGAFGLMQFMPETAANYDVHPDSPAAIQINGGMKKLMKNFDDWEDISDSIQRMKFTIASYNAGLGHVLDAQRLAEKHDLNPFVWDDNVEKMILNLSNPKYYQDPLSQHGYLRGVETYNYVRQIFMRYNEYKTVFPDVNRVRS
jgi:membrane-bound lytic murein transglycosylase F